MVRKPPSFVVTTPESLYLLVTSASGRAALRTIDTVIVDEIHAVARDKRGAHLALTLERLEALCDSRPNRVGLSATQRPIETVARLLVGDRPLPAIVDSGHQRALDLGLELPEGELEAVASAEQMADVLDRIAALVQEHHTTIVFVSTRSSAERFAHMLGERLGDDVVAAHHGSLSKDRRYRVETRLRAGDLRALVATASLELGIDIGPVELVCQIGSPRSIATFLQRVGRSNHTRTGVPKGRLFPLTRDELVECTALLAAVRAGRLDAITLPKPPLDILAQQIVAEVAAQEWSTDDLYQLLRRAVPYNDLTREQFDEVVALTATGIETARGAARPLRAPRHRQRQGARPQGRAARGGDVGRRDPRDRRLPRALRPRRPLHRHGERGLGRRVDGRRHLPARHPLVADPAHRIRRRARARRGRRVADRPVLARRGTGPHAGALRGGVRAARAGRRVRRARRPGGRPRMVAGVDRDRSGGRRPDRRLHRGRARRAR